MEASFLRHSLRCVRHCSLSLAAICRVERIKWLVQKRSLFEPRRTIRVGASNAVTAAFQVVSATAASRVLYRLPATPVVALHSSLYAENSSQNLTGARQGLCEFDSTIYACSSHWSLCCWIPFYQYQTYSSGNGVYLSFVCFWDGGRGFEACRQEESSHCSMTNLYKKRRMDLLHVLVHTTLQSDKNEDENLNEKRIQRVEEELLLRHCHFSLCHEGNKITLDELKRCGSEVLKGISRTITVRSLTTFPRTT